MRQLLAVHPCNFQCLHPWWFIIQPSYFVWCDGVHGFLQPPYNGPSKFLSGLRKTSWDINGPKDTVKLYQNQLNPHCLLQAMILHPHIMLLIQDVSSNLSHYCHLLHMSLLLRTLYPMASVTQPSTVLPFVSSLEGEYYSNNMYVRLQTMSTSCCVGNSHHRLFI